MISNDLANRQILRLTGLRGADKLTTEARQEVTKALAQVARTSEHAGRIVDSLLQGGRYFPVPAEIYETAAKDDSYHEYNPSEWKCANCDGTGWGRGYEYHTWAGRDRQREVITRERYLELKPQVSNVAGCDYLMETAVRCDKCKLGRARKAEEQMDKAKLSEK